MNIFVVTASFGQWSDFTSVDMYLSTDENEAREMLARIHDQLSLISTQMRLDPDAEYIGFGAPEAVYNVAKRAAWEDDIALTLSSMALGAVISDRVYITHTRVDIFVTSDFEPVFPPEWLTPMITSNAHPTPSMCEIREGIRTPADKYEWLAWPYEVKYYGYKLH